ncbi:MAG TPA: isocitrate/isopropylmalate family dehydrogenase [Chthoniobacterales bacterium]|nr:isocitrate/isopropylmalate family dehydrogenase [Chthoniobacterales bacterium]
MGVLRGEGSAPELIDVALRVLEAVCQNRGLKLRVEVGGDIGSLSARRTGEYLSGEVVDFCRKIFGAGGAVLAGAAGGRFVYDMRRQFNLYYKLNPLRSYQELRDVCRIKLPAKALDVLLVRENLQGIYQGDSVENASEDGREVSHTFVHNEKQVRAVLEVAAAKARSRRNLLTVIGKNSGAPAVHALWGACAIEVSQATDVEFSMLDIDYAAYKLLQEPDSFDVIVAPNCFGDILSDLGGVLAGARGLTFGASYSAEGAAVYQTNHGAAYDIAGSDMANPVGQIFSIAMMLRETFGLRTEAQLVEDSVRGVWRNGWRSADLAETGCKIAGTRQFGELVAGEICNAAVQDEVCSAIG